MKEEEELTSDGGLTFGITAFHIRALAENPFDGGAGYTLQQVAEMTPDQICFRLCEINLLKRPVGKRVSKEARLPAKDGSLVRGVAADGTPVQKRIRIGGKSLARRLAEEAADKKE